MSSQTTEWQDFNKKILESIDFKTEYESIGVESSGGPNGQGWVKCKSFFSDKADRNPSAGFNVNTGRYKSFTNEGENYSFFEFMARAAAGKYKDWEAVRNEYATRANLTPPAKQKKTESKKPDSNLTFGDYNTSLVHAWCANHKHGVKEYAIKASGARVAQWPSTKKFNVIATPIYGPQLLTADPVGWVACNLSGQPLPLFQGPDAPVRPVKILTCGYSQSGLMNAYGLSILPTADYVWKNEGPSDMWAWQSHIPKSEIRKHAIVCNSGGSMEIATLPKFLHHFAGKKMIICHDCDKDGWFGGHRQAELYASQAAEVRYYRLPFRLTIDHGVDMRDYLNGDKRPCAHCKGTGNKSCEHTSFEDLTAGVVTREINGESRKDFPLGDCEVCFGTSIARPDAPESDKLPLPTFESVLTDAMNSPVIAHKQGEITTAADGEIVNSPSDGILLMEKKICDELRIIVDGELSSTKVKVWSLYHHKFCEIEPSKMSMEGLMQMCGPLAKLKVHIGRDEIPEMFRLQQVREAISLLAGYRRAGVDELGQGCWAGVAEPGATKTPIVLVGAGEALMWDGHETLDRCDSPFVAGLTVDLNQKKPWFDFQKLSRYLEQAKDKEWCQAAVDRSITLFEHWYWKQSTAPYVMAGLVMASWVQTLWKWRPLVAVTGPSDCGKSTLFEVLDTLFGNLALSSSKSSEAGLRQMIGNGATVVLNDEFESDQYRAKVLEFLRTASRGATMFRGTTGQHGQSFGLKHIVWVAAIELGMDREPDRNRFITLELQRPPKEKRGKLTLPPIPEIEDLGLRLLAVALKYFDEARVYAEAIKGTVVPGVHGRVVESFSVPVGLLGTMSGLSIQSTCNSMLKDVLNGFDFQAQNQLDEEELVQTILSSVVDLGHGNRASVSQILNCPENYSGGIDALERVGIAVCRSEKGRKPTDTSIEWENSDKQLFIDHKAVKRYLMKGTAWETQSIDQILKRLPGAERTQRRIAGHRPHGVVIPFDYLHDKFLGRPSDPPPNDGDGFTFDSF